MDLDHRGAREMDLTDPMAAEDQADSEAEAFPASAVPARAASEAGVGLAGR